jgi:hypothetical protein
VQILAQGDEAVLEKKYENAVKGTFNRLEIEGQKMCSVINYDKEKICGKW